MPKAEFSPCAKDTIYFGLRLKETRAAQNSIIDETDIVLDNVSRKKRNKRKGRFAKEKEFQMFKELRHSHDQYAGKKE